MGHFRHKRRPFQPDRKSPSCSGEIICPANVRFLHASLESLNRPGWKGQSIICGRFLVSHISGLGIFRAIMEHSFLGCPVLSLN